MEQQTQLQNKVVSSPANKPVGGNKFLKGLAIFVLIILAFSYWYISIPAAFLWYLWTKNKSRKNANIAITAVVVLIFGILGGISINNQRSPILKVSEPQNNFSVQAASVQVKGKVNPNGSILTINGLAVPVNSDGSFSVEFQLPKEHNTAALKAENGGKTASTVLSITRIFSTEEKAEIARLKAEADVKAAAQQAETARLKAVADAKAKADQAAYASTLAGKLCTKNPGWFKQECQDVADKKLWIGMLIEMVRAERGAPSVVNTSNYGSGEQFQACWYNLTPSCFYYKENGVVSAYN